MERKEYNGWFNYETWVVNLWMDNEKGSYDYWREESKRCFEECARPETRSYSTQTQKEAAACMLADVIKSEHEESMPEVEGFAADLLNAAMSEVNWYEIAEHLLDEFPDQAAAETA
jgi:phage/plasmid primase-like uncharacterized protein